MMSITNQVKTSLASVAIADAKDTLYKTVQRKLMMMQGHANTIEGISRDNQHSLTTTIREKDQVLDRKTITTPILKTTTPVNHITETKISTTRTTLTQDKINAVDKIITTFLQDRTTIPTLSITETFLRINLMLTLVTCNS